MVNYEALAYVRLGTVAARGHFYKWGSAVQKVRWASPISQQD